MRRALGALAAILMLCSPYGASAQEAASQRYEACRNADDRIQGICDTVDDIKGRLSSYSEEAHRRRWGELHYALGMALYAIGATGDEQALRDSIAASRTAAEYYTRERTPTRWSAIHIHIAGSLLSLGDEASVTEAVDVARAAAETVDRADQPQLWASAHVALGDALWMHARITGDRQALIDAAEAVRAALEVYRRPSLAEQRARAERLLEGILNDLGGGEADNT